MPAAIPPCGCFASSVSGATPGAMAWSPPMPAAYVRPRAWPPGNAARGSRCRSWPSPAYQPLTPRRATWLVLRREEQRTEAEAQQLAQLRAQHAEVAEAIDLAQDFATLVRQRQPTQLDPWLKRATTSTLEALRRFATGLYEDYDAVKAGVTLPWSTGPVEGHINRLKMLKRQMFGRARLDLLSRRFVRAPAREQEALPNQGEWPPSSQRRAGHGGIPRLTSSVDVLGTSAGAAQERQMIA